MLCNMLLYTLIFYITADFMRIKVMEMHEYNIKYYNDARWNYIWVYSTQCDFLDKNPTHSCYLCTVQFKLNLTSTCMITSPLDMFFIMLITWNTCLHVHKIVQLTITHKRGYMLACTHEVCCLCCVLWCAL